MAPADTPKFDSPGADAPDSAFLVDLWKGQGQQHLNRGEIEQAAERLGAALELAPRDGVALGLRAVALMRMADRDGARRMAAAALNGGETALFDYVRIGGWLLAAEGAGADVTEAGIANWEAFQALSDITVEAAGGDGAVLYRLADHAYNCRQLTLAKRALEEFVKLAPDHRDAWSMLADTRLTICEFGGYDAFRRTLIERTEQELAAGGEVTVDPYSLESLGIEFGLFNAACRRRSEKIAAAAAGRALPAPPIKAGARLRIGFLLPYSWFSSVNLILDAVVPRIGRDRFDVSGYSIQTAPEPDDFETAYRARYDRFVDLPKDDPDRAAGLIRAEGVDILLDTTGHTRTNCLDILARRPAPVQAHYLGYNNTIAADFVDYLFTDENHFGADVRPLAQDRLALMPGTVAIYRGQPVAAAGGRSDFGLPEDRFVFCCFNHSGKIEPNIFDAWMRILARCPDAVLALLHWNMREVEINLRAAATARGLDDGRLIVLAPIAHDQHLRRLSLCDVALDTYYLGGGVTTLDALWTGVPILSVRPDMPLPHNGSTYLGAMDAGDLVAPDLDRYVDHACRLYADPDAVAAVKSRLLQRRASAPLFDVERHAKLLERLFLAFWENYVGGKTGTVSLADEI